MRKGCGSYLGRREASQARGHDGDAIPAAPSSRRSAPTITSGSSGDGTIGHCPR